RPERRSTPERLSLPIGPLSPENSQPLDFERMRGIELGNTQRGKGSCKPVPMSLKLKHALSNHRMREKRARKNRCIRCGQSNANGHRTCSECLAYIKGRMRQKDGVPF